MNALIAILGAALLFVIFGCLRRDRGGCEACGGNCHACHGPEAETRTQGGSTDAHS